MGCGGTAQGRTTITPAAVPFPDWGQSVSPPPSLVAGEDGSPKDYGSAERAGKVGAPSAGTDETSCA